MADKGVKFTESAAKRVIEATRYVEQQYRLPVPERPRAPDNGGGLIMLHVTTALNPMSGATPGINGRGKIQNFNGTTYSDFSSTIYQIINDTNNTIAVGAYVLCASGPGGYYHMVTLDKCSNAS